MTNGDDKNDVQDHVLLDTDEQTIHDQHRMNDKEADGMKDDEARQEGVVAIHLLIHHQEKDVLDQTLQGLVQKFVSSKNGIGILMILETTTTTTMTMMMITHMVTVVILQLHLVQVMMKMTRKNGKHSKLKRLWKMRELSGGEGDLNAWM